MNFSDRTYAAFGTGKPEHSPADRLEALHKVAEAARHFRDLGDDPNLEATWQALVSALRELDTIERYMGIAHPIVNAAKLPQGVPS